jgi:flagellar biosynthesis anti-sigma factor FlgM
MMKIDGKNIGPMTAKVDTGRSAKADGAKSHGLDAKAKAKSPANVDVSERAQMMAKAKHIASQHSEVDEAKVARLQKLIDDGNYKVDSEAVADRLLEEHMTIPD